MPRRITATEKWADPWFYNLKPGQKLLWLWILDHCDIAGTVEIDLKMAGAQIGAKVTFEGMDGRIEPIGNGRYLVLGFIAFQQGRPFSQLDANNGAHRSIIKLVEKYGILERVDKGVVRGQPLIGIGIGKGIGTGKTTEPVAAFVAPTLAEVEAYMEGQMPAVAKRCQGITKLVFPKQEAPLFIGYYSQKDWLVKGKRMKSWQQAAYNWLIKSYQFKQEKAAR